MPVHIDLINGTAQLSGGNATPARGMVLRESGRGHHHTSASRTSSALVQGRPPASVTIQRHTARLMFEYTRESALVRKPLLHRRYNSFANLPDAQVQRRILPLATKMATR